MFSVEYSHAGDLDHALVSIPKNRPNAVSFWGDPVAGERRQDLCDFALKNRLPTLGPGGRYIESGCLISYAPDLFDQFRRAALLSTKFLRAPDPPICRWNNLRSMS